MTRKNYAHMFSRTFSFIIIALAVMTCAAPPRVAAQTPRGNDVVIVLPFENQSNRGEFNWIGASFADALTELLNVPGLSVVSTDERELTYQRLHLPIASVPSRATAIKIAQEAKATLVVLGTYDVTPKQDDKTRSEIRGTVRVIRVAEGRLAGDVMPDGRWGWRPFDFGDSLTNLQKMQGTLAYQILYQRDKALPFSLNKILEQATKVPPRAFESYAKGIMTDDREKRSNYLQNALKEYAKVNAGAVYPQAAFELGNLYYQQEDWKKANEFYTQLQPKDPHFAEASFYASLSYWRLHDLPKALELISPLTSDVPLTGIYNNAGALSAQAARAEKAAAERERLLKQALTFLERARDTAPDDPSVRYNYAYALFLASKYPEAAAQLRTVITQAPRGEGSGDAFFLLAKALERAGQTEQAAAADNEARRYMQSYATAQTAWQKSQSIADVPLRLSTKFDLSDYIAITTPPPGEEPAGASAQDSLAKAKELYQAGNDDDALSELNRALMVEPMNAEAHLMIGRIYQRRGDLQRAVSSLKTALFWSDQKLIDAHILLGRIFLERGDRAQAMTHARAAIQLDPNNQEAIALQRQVETGTK
ncbi:MAG: tetratricopeptide repeat protein [Pyrinomonadaceae bacterium]